MKTTCLLLLSLVVGAALIGCKGDEAPTGESTANMKAGTQPGEGKQAGQGAVAPDQATQAPPGVKTGTP